MASCVSVLSNAERGSGSQIGHGRRVFGRIGDRMIYNDPPVNDFDPDSEDFETQTLPLDEIMRLAVQDGLQKMRVWFPAQITKISANQTVDIQPLFVIRYKTGKTANMPVIHNVPVSMPMGSDFSIKLPIAVGDT